MSDTPTRAENDRPIAAPRNVLVFENELNVGGVEKKLLDFATRVDLSRCRLKVCCLKSGGYLKQAFVDLGIPFYDEMLRHKYDALAYRKFARAIRREGIDVVYTFPHPNTLAFAATAKMRGLVKAVIVAFHGAESGKPEIAAFQRLFLRWADVFLAVGEEHRRFLIERERLEPSKIHIISNGVDTERYRPGDATAELRSEIDIPGDAKVIMTVASLKPIKAVDVLLRAGARLERREDDVRIVIVGDGPDRAKLQALAASLGIADRVRFTGVRDDVEDLLRLADVFVLSSDSEAFPNVVLEAMAAGVPVVATNVGCVREIVSDGVSGVIVPRQGAAEIAAAVDGLLDDPERANAFGQEGRRIVTERFSLDAMCRRREDVIERVFLESSGGNAPPRAADR